MCSKYSIIDINTKKTIIDNIEIIKNTNYLKLTKEEQADTDIDINIGNDIDVDMDEDIGSGNNVEVKVLEPDVKEEDITPLSDEAMKTDKQWNPDEEPVALTPEELDKLGNVNPLDNTNLF